jgi:hypothetical protein
MEEMIGKIRRAIHARGEYLYFIHRELVKEIGKDRAERVLRQALRSYGQNLGKKMGRMERPDQFLEKIRMGNPQEVFERSFPEQGDHESLMQMNHCALVESWRNLGCSPEEVHLLCSLAMEGDFGIFDGQPIKMYLESSIGDEKNCCLLRISRRTG